MASFIPNLQTTNISMWTIPAFWVISLGPRFLVSKPAYEQATKKKFDDRAPRGFVKTVESDQALDSATRGRIVRAEYATANGFENFGIFTAALVAGNAARLPPQLLNTLSLTYLATRVAFNIFYVNNSTPALATARSLSYVAGMGILFYTFITSGTELSRTLKL